MKKLVLTLIAALGFCGLVSAQNYESHWPDFYGPAFDFQTPFVAAIQIDGQLITEEYEGWNALEIAFFVGDECRGAGSIFPDAVPFTYYLYNGYVEEYGDPFPVIDGAALYYNNGDEEVTVKVYDHLRGIEYTGCVVTLEGEPYTILTGADNDQGWYDPENPIMLSFTTPATSYDKYIYGYVSESATDHWYLLSSPIGDVAATDVANMTTGTYDLYYFDQAQDLEWINYQDSIDGGFDLVSGKGYLYANSTDVTLTFTGTPYDGDGVVTLVKEDGVEFAGWNLVGNPFCETAYIGDRDFYVMNEEGTEIVAATENAIAPMQGIFVIAEENGETLIFTTEAPNKNARLALNLICNNNVVDRAIVNFGKGTLPKFQLNPNSTKVYIPVEGEDFAVVSAGATGEMPVNFKAAKNGNYTLSFTSQEVTFTYLHLIDNMTGNDVNLLSTPSYNFDARTTDYASRFRLVFATGSSIDGDSFGFVNGMGNLCIFGIEGEATLQVVDVLGHVISSNQFSGSYESKLNVAPGTYMLRLIQGDNVMVQKMVIK